MYHEQNLSDAFCYNYRFYVYTCNFLVEAMISDNRIITVCRIVRIFYINEAHISAYIVYTG